MDSSIEQMLQTLHWLRAEIQQKGVELFSQDLQNPDLNPAYHNEDFVKPMNEVGLILRDHGFPSLAQEFYLKLIDIAKEYREKHKVPRHIGMLYANLAITYISLNDIDQAFYHFHNAANEDAIAGIAHDSSYAKNLLEDRITRRIKYRFLTTVSSIDPSITMSDIDSRWNDLQYGRAFALIAYLNVFYRILIFIRILEMLNFNIHIGKYLV